MVGLEKSQCAIIGPLAAQRLGQRQRGVGPFGRSAGLIQGGAKLNFSIAILTVLQRGATHAQAVEIRRGPQGAGRTPQACAKGDPKT